MTSASTALRVSISLLDASCGVFGGPFRSITSQSTISISSGRHNWPDRSACAPPSWTCLKTIGDITTRALTVNHNWVGETCTGQRAGTRPGWTSPRAFESFRWGVLSAGHCGAFRHPILGDQRCGGGAVPERPVVMITSSLLPSSFCSFCGFVW
jgi:hypothetical protein